MIGEALPAGADEADFGALHALQGGQDGQVVGEALGVARLGLVEQRAADRELGFEPFEGLGLPGGENERVFDLDKRPQGGLHKGREGAGEHRAGALDLGPTPAAVDQRGDDLAGETPDPAVDEIAEAVGLKSGGGAEGERWEASGDGSADALVSGRDAEPGGADVGAAVEQRRGQPGRGQGRGSGQRGQLAGEVDAGGGRAAEQQRELMFERRPPGLHRGELAAGGEQQLLLLQHIGRRREPFAKAEAHQFEQGLVGLDLALQQRLGRALLDERIPEIGRLRGEAHGEGFVVEPRRARVEIGGAGGSAEAIPEVDLVGGGERETVALIDARLDARGGTRRADAEGRRIHPTRPDARLRIDLRPQRRALLLGERLRLPQPRVGLHEVEVLFEQASHHGIEGGITQCHPPAIGRLDRACALLPAIGQPRRAELHRVERHIVGPPRGVHGITGHQRTGGEEDRGSHQTSSNERSICGCF